MSSLIIPGDWARQPHPGVQVDRSHRLSRGLVEALSPTQHRLTNVNSAQIVGVTGGLAFKGNGSNSYLWKTYSGPQITDQISLLVVSHGAGTTSGVSLGVSSSASATPFLRLRTDSSGASLGNFFYRTPASVLVGTGTATAFEDAKNHVLVATIGGGVVRFYVDGKLVDSSSSSPTWAAGTMDLVTIGAALAVSASSYQSAGTLLGCVWNTALAREDVIEISRNPWQIFQPIPRRIFAVSAAGGTSVTADGALPAASLTAATGSATGAATASGSLAAASLTAPTGSATGSAITSGSLQAISLSAATGSAATAGSAAADGALTVIGLTAPDATATISIQAQAALAAIFLTPAEGSATGSAVCSGDFAPISLTACRASASNGLESAEALRKSVFLKISNPSYVIRV